MNLEIIFSKYKVETLHGRYITLNDIVPILSKLNTENQLAIEGYSVFKEPIYSYQIGTGKIKIFLWSQMHGNESTTTKALFDFLNLLQSNSILVKASNRRQAGKTLNFNNSKIMIVDWFYRCI